MKYTRLGNFIAAILVLIIALSICINLFNLVFRDGRGASMYGTRGGVYEYEGE